MYLRLATAQLDPVVGDLAGNVGRIAGRPGPRPRRPGRDLCALPGAGRHRVPARGPAAQARLRGRQRGRVWTRWPRPPATAWPWSGSSSRWVAADPAARAGTEATWAGDGGRPPARLANAAAVCAGGPRRRRLPQATAAQLRRLRRAALVRPGRRAADRSTRSPASRSGVSICEDVWSAGGPVAALGRAGAQVVVNLNASPYSQGRRAERLAMLRDRVAEAGCAHRLRATRSAARTSWSSTGRAWWSGEDGTLLAAGAQFDEDLVVVDVAVPERSGSPGRASAPGGRRRRSRRRGPARAPTALARRLPRRSAAEAEVYEALVLGTRDYLREERLHRRRDRACPGASTRRWWPPSPSTPSGPSTCTGCRCRRATRATGRVSDAAGLAERLGIDLLVVPIEPAHRALAELLGAGAGRPAVGASPTRTSSRGSGACC